MRIKNHGNLILRANKYNKTFRILATALREMSNNILFCKIILHFVGLHCLWIIWVIVSAVILFS